MVEGIVVISGMLVFFGLVVGVRNAYGAKLDLQQGTRSNVLYSASHACQGGGGNLGLSMPAGATNGPTGGFGSVATSWNVASQGPVTANIPWTIVIDNGGGGPISYQHKGITTTASAVSTCVCNEPSYQSGLTDWFTFGINLFKSGGGFAALGKLF